MATLAKLTFLVGAGIAGTLLTKEGSLFDVADFFSGTFKIFRRHLQQDKASSSSAAKPQNELLLAQVNNLRKQLQSLQSSGPVTIVTGSSSGSGSLKVTVIVVVGAFGYGYIWWKSTKRHLSSRIDRVDCSLNDCIELSTATKDEVSNLHGELGQIHTNVENVHVKVRSLETKLGRIEGSQDLTTRGIRHLCEFVMNLERIKNQKRIKVAASPTPLALEPPQATPATTNGSVKPISKAPETSSSSSPSIESQSPRVLRAVTVSASGLKELQEVSTPLRGGHFRPNVIRTSTSDVGQGTPAAQERTDNTSSGYSRFGWKLPGLLSRTRSAS